MGRIAGDHAEAYRRVMSTWPSMMVGTAEGDLPKLFSLNKGDLSLIFIQRHRLNYFNHTHAHARKRARARKVANTCTRARKHALRVKLQAIGTEIARLAYRFSKKLQKVLNAKRKPIALAF